METIKPQNTATLAEEHDTLSAMYSADRAAGTISPEDVEVYQELIAENRNRSMPLIVEFKNSGPQEIPVTTKVGGQAVDATYRQVREDGWR